MIHSSQMNRYKQSLVIRKVQMHSTCRKKHYKKMWISANKKEQNQTIVKQSFSRSKNKI